MMEYLACLKRVRGNNDHECRLLAKDYLKCRMDRQLMMEDKMDNLGFSEEVMRAGDAAMARNKVAGLSKLDELKRENARLVEERRKKEGGGGREGRRV